MKKAGIIILIIAVVSLFVYLILRGEYKSKVIDMPDEVYLKDPNGT
jgi:hypothetical protein